MSATLTATTDIPLPRRDARWRDFSLVTLKGAAVSHDYTRICFEQVFADLATAYPPEQRTRENFELLWARRRETRAPRSTTTTMAVPVL